MKKFFLYVLSAVLIINLAFTSQAYAAAGLSRNLQPYKLMPIDEEDPDPVDVTPVVEPVYTTLSMGNEFLFRITSFSEAQRAMEIYRAFLAGSSVEGFNYADLAKQINMAQSGTINDDINQSSGNVSYAVSQIRSLFQSKLVCLLDNNAVSTFTDTVQNGFNVDTSTSHSFLIFSKKSGSSYTCQFKLLAGSLQNVNGNTILTMVPAEITVNVRIKVRKVLGITIKKKKHYDVHINATSYSYNFG